MRTINFDVSDVAALAPSSILLLEMFSKRLGVPLKGVTQFDIEAARVSFELEQQLRASMCAGAESPEDRYERELSERDIARRNAASAKRHSAKMNRTPVWADQSAISAMYAEARRLTVSTGVEHHVDHVLPLQGRLVSGLHVENNLQILTWSDNVRKNNRYEVEA